MGRMTYARQRYVLHEPHAPQGKSRRSEGYWLLAVLLAFVAGFLFGRAWPLSLASLQNPSAMVLKAERSVFYRDCAQARAAGAAPIYAGQPGYRPGHDRDGDGVACGPQP